MQRCETNENADLLVEIKIGNTCSPLKLNYVTFSQNVSQPRDIKLSMAILHLQILTFILKFFCLIICTISIYDFYLTESGTTLRTFRQHLPLLRLFHVQIFQHIQRIRYIYTYTYIYLVQTCSRVLLKITGLAVLRVN